MKKQAGGSSEAHAHRLGGLAQPEYVFRLYIIDSTLPSQNAVANAHEICEHYLHGDYCLDVIDLHQQPQLAQRDQVIAVPMLIKQSPLPVRRVIGDLSNADAVLIGLGLQRAL